jgi:uncharacterized protein (DUF486 family)
MSFASSLIQPSHWPYIAPILMLFLSNLFMTLAWYGSQFRPCRWPLSFW